MLFQYWFILMLFRTGWVIKGKKNTRIAFRKYDSCVEENILSIFISAMFIFVLFYFSLLTKYISEKK